MRKILESCPSCGGALAITEVRCQVCQTEVRSQYRPCDFCALTEEQTTFVRLFVQSRGKLNAMEELLGISYPTVSSKLDEIIARLQGSVAQRAAQSTAPTRPASPVPPVPPVAPVPPVPPIPPVPPMPPVARVPAGTAPGRAIAGLSRRQALERLEAGAISPEDALATLRALTNAAPAQNAAPEPTPAPEPASPAGMESSTASAAEEEVY
jgi:hypothetical protein